MKIKHNLLIIASTLFLVGCGSNSSSEATLSSLEVSSSEIVSSSEEIVSSSEELPSSSEILSSSSEELSSSEAIPEGFVVTFENNEFVTLSVYEDRDLEAVDSALPYMSRDDEGNYSRDVENSEINFKLILTEGYFVEKFEISGTYNKIKNPADLEIDDAYRITGIGSDLSVKFVVTNKLSGFNATFNVDPQATLTIYTDKDYQTVDTDAQIQTRDGGEYSKNPEQAQLNFKIVVPEGYEAIVTATEGAYKNIKGPDECGENCWRVTKINQDIEITITITELEGPIVNGFVATFDVDEGVKEIHIYNDSDAWDNLETYTVGLQAISTVGGVESKADKAQINFVVILKENFKIKSVTATEGSYKNLKDPTEDGFPSNGYRLTKVTSDLTVTIVTEAI